MEYVYAAMLLHKAGKAIDEASVKKVLEAAGVHADAGRIKTLVVALDGVNIEEAIKNASFAAAPVSAAPHHGDAKDHGSEKKKEEKKEEKVSEESAAAGLGSLFG